MNKREQTRIELNRVNAKNRDLVLNWMKGEIEIRG